MTEWKLAERYVFNGRTVRYGVTGDGPAVIVVHLFRYTCSSRKRVTNGNIYKMPYFYIW